MKKKLIIATTIAAGLISYLLVRKRYDDQNKYSVSKLKGHSHDHHLTNVFAKAKKRATH